MTATSAQSASNANPFPAESARTVLLPGSPATYANRAYLRDLGLRWDPKGHQWHGTTPQDVVRVLREQLGLEVRCFGTLDPPTGPSPPAPPGPLAVASRTATPVLGSDPARRFPTPRFGDYSRTRFESRVAFGGPDESEDAEGVATPPRQFSFLEITSGLPDDSREDDEKQEERRLRELRARVKAARAVVSTTRGLADILVRDRQKAARFYARYGIAEAMFRQGVRDI